MNFYARRLAPSIIVLAVAHSVIAQPADPNRLLAKRAAEADAYRKLAETIKGIEISSTTYVRDFVTESDTIESQFDEFIKGVRLGTARYYDNDSCEVEAEVTVAKVVEHLKEIHTRHYEGDWIVGTDFDNIEKQIQENIIKAVGMGAPRPDLPPDLPAGVEDVITRVPSAPTAAPLFASFPPIWSGVAPQGKLMAAQAARRDAQRKLLERIRGVRINSEMLVRDFVTENGSIAAEATGIVIGAEEIDRYYHDHELIVEVTMSIPTEQILRTIKELHSRYYQGDRVTGTDIKRISENITRKTFEATGAGVPGARFLRQTLQQEPGGTTIITPEWVSRRIIATGHGTDPDMGTPQGKLKAIRAAISDARRQLIEQIRSLNIQSETSVLDFVTERDEVRAQIQSVIAGSVVESQNVDAEMATVTVSIGGPDVWRVIGDQMAVESNR